MKHIYYSNVTKASFIIPLKKIDAYGCIVITNQSFSLFHSYSLVFLSKIVHWFIYHVLLFQVGNFRVEPLGLFRGWGEHPKVVLYTIATLLLFSYLHVTGKSFRIYIFFVITESLVFTRDGKTQETDSTTGHHYQYRKKCSNSWMSNTWSKVIY